MWRIWKKLFSVESIWSLNCSACCVIIRSVYEYCPCNVQSTFEKKPQSSNILNLIASERLVQTREYLMYYRGPVFLVVVWLGSFPLSFPPPPLPSVSWTGDTQEDWEGETTGWREREGGGGRSQIIRQRENLVLYNTVHTLWSKLSRFCPFKVMDI